MRLIYITIAWVIGILAGASFASREPLLWLIFFLISIVMTIVFWRNASQSFRWALVLLSFYLAGCLRIVIVDQTSDITNYIGVGGVQVEGVVVAEPEVQDTRTRIKVQAEHVTYTGGDANTQGLILVHVPRNATVQFGDKVLVTGELSMPPRFDTFSYQDYLARQSVFAIMYDGAVSTLEQGLGSALSHLLLDIKGRAKTAIRSGLPEPESGLLVGILLGDENGISPQLAEDFRVTGTSHIIAISGFNMVLISGIVMASLRSLGIPVRTRVIIGITIIVLYTALVGASPAVIRAAVMSSLLVCADMIHRKTFVPASLAFVVLLMSFIDPYVIWDVGFQLSLFAVLGLALFTTPISRYMASVLRLFLPARLAGRAQAYLQEPIAATLAAYSLTLPLSLVYFHQFSIVALVVNFLIVPVQAFVLIFGGLATIASMFSPALAQLLYWLDMLFLSWSIGIVRLFAQIPVASAEVSVDPRIVAGFFIVIIGGTVVHFAKPKWWTRVVDFFQSRLLINASLFAGILLLGLVIISVISKPDGLLHVWFLDVGHSNAVLIQSPSGNHMLIDGGQFPSRLLTSLGDRLPFNDNMIEVLAITHPDAFDYGALVDVTERYNIGLTIWNGQPNLSPEFQQLQNALNDAESLNIEAGYALEFEDGLIIEVLNPDHTPALNEEITDNVLVLKVSYGEVSFLLTSDISLEGQEELLSGIIPLTATVLQIPQHGTARGLHDELLSQVQPQVTVLQTDPSNPLGDPDMDTLAQLEALPLVRTDQQGAVHFWSDGEGLWMQPERSDESTRF